MKKLLNLLGAIALVTTGAALAQTPITFSPIADAYVQDGAWANTNFGTAGNLYTKTHSQNLDSYLKFDISGVTSVATARLGITASVSQSVTVSAYAVSDNTWLETGITWDNKPARGAALATITAAGAGWIYYEFDVTSHLVAEKAAGRNTVSFALHNPVTQNQQVWMRAREYSINQPRLVITPSVPPTVSISAPSANQVFQAPATITVSANAIDSDGTVTQVEFFANGAPIGTDTTAPFSIEWTNVAAGNYSLTARARDNAGEQTLSAAVPISVNAQPTVSITSPASGAVVQAPGNVSLTATAADSDGTVTKVEFYRDGVLIATDTESPYEASASGLAAGTYSFTAVATDDRNGTGTSAPVSVRVNAAPTVSITSPTNNATFNAPANIAITATAQDTDGTLNRVELYANSSLIGTLTTAPYSFNWTNVAAGTYALTAKAIDNNNAETLSAPVSITVRTVSTLYFMHADHLNTPRLVADASGTTVWRWDQSEPFGNNVPDENPSGLGAFDLPLRLPGQYFDKETNLHYSYYRDYDPSIGRYAESDPTGLYAGLNTYSYVEGSPLQWMDYFGLCRIEVRFKPVPGTRAKAFHSYIVTTAPSGGTPTFFRGGPGGPRSVSSPVWGAIKTTMGPYDQASPDWDAGNPPSVVVLDNDEPCECYDQSFAATLVNITNSNIGYIPGWQNSNSVVGTALSQAGFSLPTTPVTAPGFTTNLSRYFSRLSR